MLATSSRSHHSQGATSAAAAAAKKQFLEKSISLRNREAALASDLDSWVQVHGADIVIDLATSREPAQTVATPGIVKGKRPRRAGKSVPSTVIRFGNSDDTFPQGHARLKSLLHTLYSLQEQQQSQCDNVPLQPTLAEQIHRTFTQFEESLHLAHKALVEESQSLAVQEKQLSHDIAMVEDRLRALEAASTDVTVDCTLPSSFSGVATGPAGKSSSKSRLVPANTLPPEVMEFETFVAKHGPTGGWDPYAHDVFLSTLKHTCPSLLAAIASATDVELDIEAKVMDRLVSRCAESLGVPESDVEAHCEWWIEWLRLQVRKRQAIDKWRRKKQLQQQSQPVNDAAVQVGLKVGKRSNSGAGVDEEKMTEQMLKVAEWRIEKERQRIREEQAELARQRRMQEEENYRRMKRQVCHDFASPPAEFDFHTDHGIPNRRNSSNSLRTTSVGKPQQRTVPTRLCRARRRLGQASRQRRLRGSKQRIKRSRTAAGRLRSKSSKS